MSKGKHLNLEQRTLIKHLLTRNLKLYEIAEFVDKDPTTISKEIKRNRLDMSNLKHGNLHPNCKDTERFPYVCDRCTNKYRCLNKRYTYDPKHAQSMHDLRLINSRLGINMTEDEFLSYDKAIRDGVAEKRSIYHIVKENKIDNKGFDVSVSTVYNHIHKGILSTKKMDMPYMVQLKKRKVSPKYQYSDNNKIDRAGRTYLDYLKFETENPNLNIVQMDFLGSIKTDKKSVLVLTIPKVHYVLLFMVDSPNQEKISTLFDTLERLLSPDVFKEVFPAILTDRDTCFSNFNLIESSIIEGHIRTNIFYCDPMASSQKANVEQMNKQLRHHLPKGKSLELISSKILKQFENLINSSRIPSLSGFTPDEAFEAVYGGQILSTLKDIII